MNHTDLASQYQLAFTTRQVTQLTGLPGHVIRRAIRQGHLAALRPTGSRAWHISEEALRQWLDGWSVPSTRVG